MKKYVYYVVVEFERESDQSRGKAVLEMDFDAPIEAAYQLKEVVDAFIATQDNASNGMAVFYSLLREEPV